MTASSRLMNSGRKTRLSEFEQLLAHLVVGQSVSSSSSSLFRVKPSEVWRLIMSAPMLEVMTMMALRKSTLRPLASER